MACTAIFGKKEKWNVVQLTRGDLQLSKMTICGANDKNMLLGNEMVREELVIVQGKMNETNIDISFVQLALNLAALPLGQSNSHFRILIVKAIQ
ncbi:hypothetical protein D3C77_495410 [compost metagenome]